MPLISIAAELVSRGYACQLLANEHFRAASGERGIAFFSSTSRRVRSTASEGPDVVTYLFPEFDGARAYFERPHAYGPDTIAVNLDRWAASDPFAEARRLRTVRLHLSPFKIRSLASPAWPLGAHTLGILGETYKRYTLPALYRAFDIDPRVLRRVNGVRADVGLSSVDSAMYHQPHLALELALFPEWFAAPAEDWPALELLGFPLPATSAPLPARLSRFLDGRPKPLIFTPGTSVGDPQKFFDAAADCCAELDMPGVFSSPFLRFSTQRFGSKIEHVEHVELQPLLMRSALIVHHGGIGTIARALQAGVPQVICPTTFDQPDNGRRVEALGCGRVVTREGLSGARLAVAARELLGDAAQTAQLSQYRDAVNSARAIERCADLLEGLAGSPGRRLTPRRSIS